MTYNEFVEKLSELFPDFEISLGNTVEDSNGQSVVLRHVSSDIIYSDDTPMVLSSVYEVMILQRRAAFMNTRFIELTESGVQWAGIDQATSQNVFAATVLLRGPKSLPGDDDGA